MAGKICPYCYLEFTPHAKVGVRQICCGSEVCKRQHKKEVNRKWRTKNPDYSRGHYATYLKPWLEKHPGYLREYRRKKKQSARKSKNDIKDELSYVKSTSCLVFSQLHDIKDKLNALGALPGRLSP